MERLRTLNLPERTVTVEIDESKCVGIFECGKCVKSCPASVFITYPKERVKGEICNDWSIVADDTSCWGCDVCMEVCPKDAITINEIKE
jgi:ferredoxin